MKMKTIQQVWRRTLGIVLSLAMLNFSAVTAKAESGDPGVSNVNVKLDDVNFKKVLSVDLGNLISGIGPNDPNYDTCKKAALLVAQAGADNYGYWNTFMDLLAQTVKGVQIGATLGGQPTVAKVAEVAGTIVEAFNDEDPAGALGQALINESAGYAASQAKTGNDAVDQALKDAAAAARDKLIQQLFPGARKKAATYHILAPIWQSIARESVVLARTEGSRRRNGVGNHQISLFGFEMCCSARSARSSTPRRSELSVP